MATPNDRDTSRNASTLVVLVAEADDPIGVGSEVGVDGWAERLGSDDEEAVHERATSAATNRPAILDGTGTPLGERTLAHEARIGALEPCVNPGTTSPQASSGNVELRARREARQRRVTEPFGPETRR
jgi:hypothetical protein